MSEPSRFVVGERSTNRIGLNPPDRLWHTKGQSPLKAETGVRFPLGSASLITSALIFLSFSAFSPNLRKWFGRSCSPCVLQA